MDTVPWLSLLLFIRWRRDPCCARPTAQRPVEEDRSNVSLATFGVSLVVFAKFEVGNAGFQLVERLTWVPAGGSTTYLGVDGSSLLLVVLTALLFPICFMASGSVNKRVRST